MNPSQLIQTIAENAKGNARIDVITGFSSVSEEFRSLLAAAQIPAIIYRKNQMRVSFPYIKTLFLDGTVWKDQEDGFRKRNGPRTDMETGVTVALECSGFSCSTSGIVARGKYRPLYAFPSGMWNGERFIPHRDSYIFLSAGGYDIRNPLSLEDMSLVLSSYMADCVLKTAGMPSLFDDMVYALYRMELYTGRRLPFPLPEPLMEDIWASASDLSSPVLDMNGLSVRLGACGHAVKTLYLEDAVSETANVTVEKRVSDGAVSFDESKIPFLAAAKEKAVEAGL